MFSEPRGYEPKKKDDFPHPQNTDYQYDPKPMSDIPPVGQHEFYKRFYYPSTKDWFFFQQRRCNSKRPLGHCQEVVRMLPKKASGLDESDSRREPFWGIYARQRVCFRWVITYVVICILPAIVFFFEWLFGLHRPFDLQTASVPLQMMTALLAVFSALFIPSLNAASSK